MTDYSRIWDARATEEMAWQRPLIQTVLICACLGWSSSSVDYECGGQFASRFVEFIMYLNTHRFVLLVMSVGDMLVSKLALDVSSSGTGCQIKSTLHNAFCTKSGTVKLRSHVKRLRTTSCSFVGICVCLLSCVNVSRFDTNAIEN